MVCTFDIFGTSYFTVRGNVSFQSVPYSFIRSISVEAIENKFHCTSTTKALAHRPCIRLKVEIYPYICCIVFLVLLILSTNGMKNWRWNNHGKYSIKGVFQAISTCHLPTYAYPMQGILGSWPHGWTALHFMSRDTKNVLFESCTGKRTW